jgi:hypothetical protein
MEAKGNPWWGPASTLLENTGVFMSFEAVWGFDPDEVGRAQAAFRQRIEAHEAVHNGAAEGAARIPPDTCSQVYELRRIFRL